MGEAEALTSFVDIFSGGIERVFAEAKEILDRLNVFGGDIAENIEKPMIWLRLVCKIFLVLLLKKNNTDHLKSY